VLLIVYVHIPAEPIGATHHRGRSMGYSEVGKSSADEMKSPTTPQMSHSPDTTDTDDPK